MEVVSSGNSDQCEGKTNSNSRRRPRILPCYICGRPFSISSINIHEPQCLKKWNIQNDKLPKDKRRPEPKKPDFVFTPVGELNYEATFDRIWDNHLSELIPCNQCGRTFFPDRIEKHERACAGNGLKVKAIK
ncbi:zinc finger protein 474-like [Agrilus planipennis]|uniref:Zinc finger protein 474-like n=1 Tax=Agrilus planipennis TaxID=224129 RepID=A0A1W4XP91_AGRPL|nr:zinc finger protein 474-like [Agrilus planipennis]